MKVCLSWCSVELCKSLTVECPHFLETFQEWVCQCLVGAFLEMVDCPSASVSEGNPASAFWEPEIQTLSIHIDSCKLTQKPALGFSRHLLVPSQSMCNQDLVTGIWVRLERLQPTPSACVSSRRLFSAGSLEVRGRACKGMLVLRPTLAALVFQNVGGRDITHERGRHIVPS